jgi:uncharacterized protein (DUF1810 family)
MLRASATGRGRFLPDVVPPTPLAYAVDTDPYRLQRFVRAQSPEAVADVLASLRAVFVPHDAPRHRWVSHMLPSAPPLTDARNEERAGKSITSEWVMRDGRGLVTADRAAVAYLRLPPQQLPSGESVHLRENYLRVLKEVFEQARLRQDDSTMLLLGPPAHRKVQASVNLFHRAAMEVGDVDVAAATASLEERTVLRQGSTSWKDGP